MLKLKNDDIFNFIEPMILHLSGLKFKLVQHKQTIFVYLNTILMCVKFLIFI